MLKDKPNPHDVCLIYLKIINNTKQNHSLKLILLIAFRSLMHDKPWLKEE